MTRSSFQTLIVSVKGYDEIVLFPLVH
jgi:hypothetical protein